MGARTGYSILNGVAVTGLCLVGGVTLVLKVVPLEATLGILLWIGLIIMAQAFQETPRRHALAVAIGFIPALAAWALLVVDASVRAAGSTLYAAAPKFGSDLMLAGVIAMNQGFILTSMVLAAMLALIIDREFLKAAGWAAAGAGLSAVGIMHAYQLTPLGVQNQFGWLAAPQFVVGYGLTALMLAGLHFQQKTPPRAPVAEERSGP